MPVRLSVVLVVTAAPRRWLAATLAHVQASADVQWMAVNGGADPEHWALVEQHAGHLTVLDAPPTADPSAALAHGVAQAQGDFIAWLLPGEALTAPAALAGLAADAEMVCGAYVLAAEGSEEAAGLSGDIDFALPTAWPLLLVRRSLLAQHGPPDLSRASQHEYWLRVQGQARWQALGDRPLGISWRHSLGAVVMPSLAAIGDIQAAFARHGQAATPLLSRLFEQRWLGLQRQYWAIPQLTSRALLNELAALPAPLRPAAGLALASWRSRQPHFWGQACFDALARFDTSTARRTLPHAVREQPALLRNRGFYVSFLRTWLTRRLTSRLRRLPDFLIIGAQRGGTTSLFNYLAGHPAVAAVRDKELHYFDLNLSAGRGWYQAHFPLRLARAQRVGEATPMYLFHPAAPQAVQALLPRVKLIALLRNPVDRAYSHYQLERRSGRQGIESLSFADAVAAEQERLAGDMDRLQTDPASPGFAPMHFSYLARGLYVDQLQAWRRFFPAGQMLILRSEDFYEQPALIFRQVLDFLELPAWEPTAYRPFNQTGGQISGQISDFSEKPAVFGELAAFFRPHNRRLTDFLGRDFGWDDPA
ncbi:sulfotransferase domain-containing protein [Candidatus Amarolinea dominans]|uniref:sulfotransferase domain-containing protein n=1 Tax=Candidatus Amarolinea dominans TaxID=3140696 RepID=UPI0031CCC45A